MSRSTASATRTVRGLIARNNGCGNSASAACYRVASDIQNDGIDLNARVGHMTPNWDRLVSYNAMRAKYLSDTTASKVGKRFNTDLIAQRILKR